jgi:hypothetical protein
MEKRIKLNGCRNGILKVLKGGPMEERCGRKLPGPAMVVS